MQGGKETFAFTATTKATEAGRAKTPKSKQQPAEHLTPEQEAEKEEERVARIAQIRKQFKKKQKDHLLQLIAKRRLEEETQAILKEEKERKRKMVKEKGLKRVMKERLKRQQMAEAHDADAEDMTPRGSAVAAIRAARESISAGATGSQSARQNERQRSIPRRVSSATPSMPQEDAQGQRPRSHPEQMVGESRKARNIQEDGEENEDQTAESRAERKRRAREMRIAREKQQELLRKLEEDAKKQKEQGDKKKARLEKRAQLKRDRILAEAAERKRVQEEEARCEQDAENTAEGPNDRKAALERRNPAGAKGKRVDRHRGTEASSTDMGAHTDERAGEDAAGTTAELSEQERKERAALQRSSVQRLYTRKKQADEGLAPAARDFADWKRKHGVPSDGKVFSMTGWYPCVKDALLERGWHFNSDRDSLFFDLKWTLRSNELKQEQLQPWQLTNHFLKNTAITTKVGLLRSLRELTWHATTHSDSIYPRSFDLNSPDDMQSFLDDYRITAAEGILKELLACLGIRTYFNASRGLEETVTADEGSEENGQTSKTSSDLTGGEDSKSAGGDSEEDDDQLDDDSLSDEATARKRRHRKAMSLPEDPKLVRSILFEDPSEEALQKADSLSVNHAVVAIAMAVCSRAARGWSKEDQCHRDVSDLNGAKLKRPNGINIPDEGEDEEERYLDEYNKRLPDPISELEWEVLYAAIRLHEKRSQSDGATQKPAKSPRERETTHRSHPFDPWTLGETLATEPSKPLDGFLRGGSQHGDHVPIGGHTAGSHGSAGSMGSSQAAHNSSLKERLAREKAERRRRAAKEAARESMRQRLQESGPLGRDMVPRIIAALTGLSWRRGPGQSTLNGRDKTLNLWIVKPSAKSRGRGIQTFRDIHKLLDYVEIGEKGSSALWVVQKYMENPMLIARRKFDIRQWVLVTDWNPLTVYFYHECYARFSAQEYSDKDEDLDKSFVHLVNNSISKYSEQFHTKIIAENGEEVKDCMWSLDQLRAYLKYRHGGKDVFASRCERRMREIARDALVCAQGQVEHRKNSWELYGYDFMIDDECNPWLIEINSSPACDYSTGVTEEFVPKALSDVIKVVVDLREWEQNGKEGPKPDIGGWENIFHGQTLDTPPGTFGVELACKGVQLKKPKPKAKPRYRKPISSETTSAQAARAVSPARHTVRASRRRPRVSSESSSDDDSEDEDDSESEAEEKTTAPSAKPSPLRRVPHQETAKETMRTNGGPMASPSFRPDHNAREGNASLSSTSGHDERCESPTMAAHKHGGAQRSPDPPSATQADAPMELAGISAVKLVPALRPKKEPPKFSIKAAILKNKSPKAAKTARSQPAAPPVNARHIPEVDSSIDYDDI